MASFEIRLQRLLDLCIIQIYRIGNKNSLKKYKQMLEYFHFKKYKNSPFKGNFFSRCLYLIFQSQLLFFLKNQKNLPFKGDSFFLEVIQYLKLRISILPRDQKKIPHSRGIFLFYKFEMNHLSIIFYSSSSSSNFTPRSARIFSVILFGV